MNFNFSKFGIGKKNTPVNKILKNINFKKLTFKKINFNNHIKSDFLSKNAILGASKEQKERLYQTLEKNPRLAQRVFYTASDLIVTNNKNFLGQYDYRRSIGGGVINLNMTEMLMQNPYKIHTFTDSTTTKNIFQPESYPKRMKASKESISVKTFPNYVLKGVLWHETEHGATRRKINFRRELLRRENPELLKGDVAIGSVGYFSGRTPETEREVEMKYDAFYGLKSAEPFRSNLERYWWTKELERTKNDPIEYEATKLALEYRKGTKDKGLEPVSKYDPQLVEYKVRKKDIDSDDKVLKDKAYRKLKEMSEWVRPRQEVKYTSKPYYESIVEKKAYDRETQKVPQFLTSYDVEYLGPKYDKGIRETTQHRYYRQFDEFVDFMDKEYNAEIKQTPTLKERGKFWVYSKNQEDAERERRIFEREKKDVELPNFFDDKQKIKENEPNVTPQETVSESKVTTNFMNEKKPEDVEVEYK